MGADAAPTEEIVVTADRRERPLSNAPLSASAPTGAELRASGIDSTQDLFFRTPGFEFSTNSVLGQPYLRGVGSDLITAGSESSVATFIDGVYRPRPVGSLYDFFDVERVEVLKGPQGTFFGRNATGGLVHVVTRDPEPELEAEGDASYGSFDAIRARGVLNAPLSGDRAILRVAGLRTRRDGYTRELERGDRLDDEDLSALRGKLLVRPIDGLSLLFSADGASDHGSRNLAVKVAEPFSGSPAVALGGTVPANPRRVHFDAPTRAEVDSWGGSARLGFERDGFGVSSLMAFRRSEIREALDLDGTEIPFATNRPSEDSRAWSEELQLRWDELDSLESLAGAYYLHENVTQQLDVSFPLAGIRDIPAVGWTLTRSASSPTRRGCPGSGCAYRPASATAATGAASTSSRFSTVRSSRRSTTTLHRMRGRRAS